MGGASWGGGWEREAWAAVSLWLRGTHEMVGWDRWPERHIHSAHFVESGPL